MFVVFFCFLIAFSKLEGEKLVVLSFANELIHVFFVGKYLDFVPSWSNIIGDTEFSPRCRGIASLVAITRCEPLIVVLVGAQLFLRHRGAINFATLSRREPFSGVMQLFPDLFHSSIEDFVAR
ncbi:hypothetical protein Q1695_014871 [Nippostrongylus brasiliensis]|nr:hypothetical protein Q1695_014871 [Nippostrongylus brasiliensis]